MDTINNPEVARVFMSYPGHMREKLMFLRQLVLDTASETDSVSTVEEALKWGEPGYVTKSGSTIRIGWKESNPHHYEMYFHCRTKLVETFRELYGDKFRFEGNRAIVFNEDDEVSVNELKHCILLALSYHSRKHLPLLGVC